MKYPPVRSAHWEGAVGQWLRGQLDARGIDAPAYGRYVLSLLTRPLDPADLSPEPASDKTWDRRNQSDWPPVKLEALKKSAAIQCLLNASDDQNAGIEQLVDELCCKLKEVDELNARVGKREAQPTKTSRKERSRQLSPAEMARMYYAAFPALVPSTPDSNPDAKPPLIRSPSTSGMSYNRRSKECLLYKTTNANDKDHPRPPKKHCTKERRNTTNSHKSYNRSNAKGKGYSKSSCKNEKLPEWVNDGDVWDIDAHDPIKGSININCIDEGYGTCENTIIQDIPVSKKRHYDQNTEGIYLNRWVIDEGYKSPTKSSTEDESIAKFKAKFDRSLEALWPKEQNNTDSEYSMDLQDAASPSEKMFDCYSSDKPVPLSLTSSIWSNNDAKSDWDGSELLFHADSFHPQKFVPEISYSFIPETKINNIWSNDADTYSKDSMEILYNKLKPLNLDDSNEAAYEFKTSPKLNEYLPLKWDEDSHSNNCGTNVIQRGTPARSFDILNHNSSCSSFTEVTPRAPSGYIGDNLKRRPNLNLRMEMSKPLTDMGMKEKEEEDLLTSMRTHFRPIKHDSNDQNIVNYADGMTFSVISDLDSVKFSRSSSGSMFLESDTEPPKQYMEYRKQGIDYTRLDICSSLCSDEGMSSNDLILKFRVCQNVKGVQTDMGGAHGLIKTSEPEVTLPEPKLKSVDFCNVKTINPSDADSEMESLNINWMQCEECKSNNNQWFSSSWPSDVLNSSKIWSLDDNNCKTCSNQGTQAEMIKSSVEKSKATEEESAREWDELLSDLRYIHDLKTENNWLGDNCCVMAPTEVSYQADDGNFIKSTLMAQNKERNVIDDVKAWLIGTDGKIESNVVGKILDRSMLMYDSIWPHCEICSDHSNIVDVDEGWRVDRKRRHSTVNNDKKNSVGKLRCTLPAVRHYTRPFHLPFLPTADRPLTR